MQPKLLLHHILIAIQLSIWAGCADRQVNTLFTVVPASQSQVSFRNDIKEDTDFNILTYEYLYNGGGVATGDLNNDGLCDIVFSANMTASKIYLNKGNLKFEDITSQSGFDDRGRWKTGVVMADVNGDGLLDIYLCYSGPGTDEARANQLFINNGVKQGVPSFIEQAAKYGIDAPGTYSTMAAFFDVDNDGDLDMFLVNHADMFFNPFYNTDKLRAARHPRFGNRLYRNDNDHFTDISDAAGISGSGLNFGLSVSASDINNDGWTDIYVTNDYDESDFLYINNRIGGFTEVLSKAAGHISEFAMGSDIADYNNDLTADIMALDMLPEDNHRQKMLKGPDTYDKYNARTKAGFNRQQMRNTLQLNNGLDSTGIPIFSEVGQLAGISATDWSWAPLLADFDNDGWKDLFISNGILKDMTNLDFVKYTSGYSNNFENKQGDKMAMWELIKQMPSTKLSNYFFRNNHDLGFTDMSEEWCGRMKNISNGSAYADLDNDGDLDLVINCLTDEALILKNNASDNNSAHSLRIKFSGEGKNTSGTGAKVFVKTAGSLQLYEQFTSRGFQSSVDPVMHIGLGKDSIIEEIKVKWLSGKTSLMKAVKADQLIVIEENKASMISSETPPDEMRLPTLFTDITSASGIDFVHKESPFVDFKVSPLLLYQVSKTGPCLATADVNGDGLDDLFIGASGAQSGTLYLQQTGNTFSPALVQPWTSDKTCTITDALFFDADGDGDKDLYLVSGGADYPSNAKNYQDRIFSNDGRGNFAAEINALPIETISGGCVRAADIDHDGLPDLFVGGGLMPGHFPETPPSFVLKNKSIRDKIHFEKDNKQLDASLIHAGMVTDAVWLDLNKDGWQDLVVVGMFMPVSIFENNKGQLEVKTALYGLDNSKGWWRSILAADFDHDGDTDLVVGNMGTNTQLRASVAEPLSITYADFNNDGALDPILSIYNKGKSYPYFSRDEIFDQLPILQKKFSRYQDYADAQLTDMFSAEQLTAASTAEITSLSSIYISNQGPRSFYVKKLPSYAQLSMIKGLVSMDINGDGNLDIILAGNCYSMRVQLGPMDASIGMVLAGDGKGNFSAIRSQLSGLYLPGDITAMRQVQGANGPLLTVVKNNGRLQLIQCRMQQPGTKLSVTVNQKKNTTHQ